MDWTDDLLLFSDVMADDASCYVTAHTTEESIEHYAVSFSVSKRARARYNSWTDWTENNFDEYPLHFHQPPTNTPLLYCYTFLFLDEYADL
jgi:hypothetical protein